MTTPSCVLSKTLGGSTHSGSSLCSEYAPLGAVSMGCHCDLSCCSHAAQALLATASKADSTCGLSLPDSRNPRLTPDHHCSKLFIFHLLYAAQHSTKIHPH